MAKIDYCRSCGRKLGEPNPCLLCINMEEDCGWY